jgi:5-hydroxyisourate hydrolase
MAHLSTHVLDTARGIPAKGVRIELHRIEDGARRRVATGVTNADGRIAAPLISGDLLEIGIYELVFHAGDYLRSAGLAVSEPAFLDQVIVRFGVAELNRNYHVPLLLSPFGYSTYRGS